MKQLKKMAAVGGAVVLVICWPLAVGQIAQNVFHDGIKALGSSDFSAEVVSYDRGYLSSVATSKYTIQDPELKAQFESDGLPTEFLLKHDIKHGIFQVNAQTHFTGYEVSPAVLNTTTQLNGNTEFDLNINEFNYVASTGDNATNASIVIAPSAISGKGTVLGEVAFSFDFPLIQLQFNSGETINISSTTGYVEGKMRNGFWYGKQQINIADAGLLSPSGEVYSSGKELSYQINSSTNETGDRLEINHIVKAANVVTVDGELDNVNIDITLGQLDTDSFEKLVSLYHSTSGIDDIALANAVPILDTLFNKGFHITLNDLAVVIDEGKFQSAWMLKLPEGTQAITQDISKIIPALEGEMKTSISNQLVENYPFIHEGIDELMIMEFVKQTEDGYQIDATISDGNVTFESGQTIPLVALFMSMMR